MTNNQYTFSEVVFTALIAATVFSAMAGSGFMAFLGVIGIWAFIKL